MTDPFQSLVQADHALFFALNGMAAWGPLGAVAEGLSYLGRYGVLLVAALGLAGEGWPVFRRHALALLLAAPLAFGLNYALKETINRPRPMGVYREQAARGTVTIRGRERLMRKSFPSGHSTLAFFTLGYLAFARRRHAAWALALAAGVAWSRVAVGAHFPSDCVAGAGFGLMGAWLAWRVNRRLDKRSCTTPHEPTTPNGPSSGSCSSC